jgi:hypothetical protein
MPNAIVEGSGTAAKEMSSIAKSFPSKAELCDNSATVVGAVKPECHEAENCYHIPVVVGALNAVPMTAPPTSNCKLAIARGVRLMTHAENVYC